MISSQYGLVVFVDTAPSEQLGEQPDEILCLAGISVPDPRGLPGLKQYKAHRGLKRRTRKAEELNAALTERQLQLVAWGICGRMDCIEPYGERILGRLSGVSRCGDDYLVGGCTLHRTRAVVAGWYAAALALVAAGAAGYADALGENTVTLFVDRFPGVPEVAMKLLAQEINEGELRDEWEDLRPGLRLDTIHVNTLESYEDEDEVPRAGKDHPHAVLADWMARSLHAHENPAQLLDDGAGRSNAYKSAISKPWATVEILGTPAYTLEEWMRPPTVPG